MARTGDREIRSVSSGRLPDNPGELARMQYGSCRLRVMGSWLPSFGFIVIIG